MHALKPQPRIGVDTFFEVYADVKAELVNGVPRLMGGGNFRHASAQTNLIRHIGNALDGGPCRVLGPDMGLSINEDTIRYPDVAIYCDPRDLIGTALDRALEWPKVLFEVLSPSTARTDRIEKMREYRSIESTRTVVLVDAENRGLEVHERLNATEWRLRMLAPGEALTIVDPALTLTLEQIFGPEQPAA